MKLVIGNKNYSSWSLRPWLLLKHFQIPFEEVRVPLFTPGYKEKLLSYSEAGQVPVMLDEKVTVWESLAICEYVSEKYLNGAGWPADEIPRAQARACSAGMHAGFSRIRNLMPMNARAEGRQVEISAELESEIQRLEKMWGLLRSARGKNGPWLFGEFSIADCMFAPMSFRFNTYGVELAGNAKKYCDHLLNDPDMQEWLASAKSESEIVDFAEVGRQDYADES
ncbi:MAG: glutathione S-transferase family protein [Gammaproteobacteria bacterium]|nr:glutathione S-transferase family protein [Gammaproteobacteria bacterium]